MNGIEEISNTSRESRNLGQSWGWERPGEKPRVSERPAPEAALPAIASIRRSRGTLADKRHLFEERLPSSETLPNMGNHEGEREAEAEERPLAKVLVGEAALQIKKPPDA